MKKTLLFTTLSLLLLACTEPNNNNLQLQEKIKVLQNQLNNSYKPGLGEFMSSIQVHHSKLWFAGTNANWKLADFEVKEIKEASDNIQKFNTGRTESRSMSVIDDVIDSVSKAIQKKDMTQFKNNFVILTNTCNSCHKANNFQFNVVKVPETSPFSNQIFKLGNEK